MANYIIRIFPQNSSAPPERPAGMVGLLEDPLSGKRCRFSSAEELWDLLTERASPLPEDGAEGLPYPSPR